ncbi:DUF192 domain-containing protein [Sulfitobacter sp. HNIBRBA2951]|uniref:DUF192 domain-containing protein n=1 Tax=Sulfitobacter aquimarinus TaxID=3158557 RepID=UPI0032DFEC9D
MGDSHFDRRRVIAGLTALPLLAAGVAGAGAKTPLRACPTDRVSISGGFGKAQFGVDVADDDATRATGLMHVENLPMSRGMLFVYPRPQPLSFWMRNTLIELDMLFLDSFGVIRHIHHRAQPGDETVISPGKLPLLGALEINGGLAKRLGIKVGDVLRHPAFVSTANPWSCSG